MKQKLMQPKVWKDTITLPTYPVGEPNKNPLFLEKRVYQGSSGKIYPLPFTDTIANEKVDVTYEVVYLENEYIQVMIMPAMGGKIYRALDKTNNYDFVYYNEVVKPALVGLTGPWVSGGIEFNWPQHHRPTTFSPVEYVMSENGALGKGNSVSCTVSEVDRMYGTKGMATFTLYHDKAYIEITGQLYNRTEIPQTFLWWANPAMAVHDETKSIFPPDVHAVFDHGKRDVSKFPIATGQYYKVDYSSGVDISRYKNLPAPTSYMAYHSDHNFVGGYDFRVDAGILHIANHHISPGKKQWTWGNADFGQAWDRNLTDKNGPYIELMTGVYTDNQPDFTWLAPGEEKLFTQYFMPYKGVGEVKQATLHAIINLEFCEDFLELRQGANNEHVQCHNQHNGEHHGEVVISLYVPAPATNLRVELLARGKVLHTETIASLTPAESYEQRVTAISGVKKHEYCLRVLDTTGNVLVSYQPREPKILETPDPAVAISDPADIQTTEELYLAGVHLEQYRHATYLPEDYYLEGLKRDPKDIRLNNAYGLLVYRQGEFAKAAQHFERAVERSIEHSPNPISGEYHYNLGLSLKRLGQLHKAYNTFYKSTWNDAFQAKGLLEVATLDVLMGNYKEALSHVQRSLVNYGRNVKAHILHAAILARTSTAGGGDFLAMKASADANETSAIEQALAIDPMNLAASYMHFAITRSKATEAACINLIRGSAHNVIAAAIDLMQLGLYTEAMGLLTYAESNLGLHYPMLFYLRGYAAYMTDDRPRAEKDFILGAAALPDYCFPNALEELQALEVACELNPTDAKAHYYLGNLLYDKKRYTEAISHWEASCNLDNTFPTALRNLALAYVQVLKDTTKATPLLEQAYALNTDDARVLFELDQLYKKTGKPKEERASFLEQHLVATQSRDDLYVEYLALLNDMGQYTKVMKLIDEKIFHPWEGGEGKVPAQYKRCRIELAKQLLTDSMSPENSAKQALQLLEQCKTYPHHLGEGKLPNTADNEIDYFTGLALLKLGKSAKATTFFTAASQGDDTPTDAMFYNDSPADAIFYQGLACNQLGDSAGAKRKFNRLFDYGEKHIHDMVKIDYFAVSLPDFLVFDEDLAVKNRVHCLYLMGLGSLGLGKVSQARAFFTEAYKLNPNHQGVLSHMDF